MPALYAILAIAIFQWIVVTVLTGALLRERAEVRRLRAELAEHHPIVRRGIVTMPARGPVEVGRVVALNDDGTVSISIGDSDN